HVGAWPADLYYAELDGPWTDDLVSWEPWGVAVRNHNIPGDGYFDQSRLPSDVDLILGRIDLSDLPVYGSTPEVELLRAYLDRNHSFRTGALTFQRKAVIHENFPGLDHESAAFRSCIPMFGEENVYQDQFIASLAQESHLWSMAGGPGSYTSASGIGTSQEVANTPLNGAFAHMIGSYFGDWDTPDNFMRSTLASGSMLGVVWGLQEIAFHHMALGLPIGESVRRSQNASYNEYERQGRLINMALMGDPTLPLFPAPYVEMMDLEINANGVLVQWTEVTGDIVGYHVYRRTDPTQHFIRLNAVPVASATYLDTEPVGGNVEYMVRALKLETSASGTFEVLGTGKRATMNVVLNIHDRTSYGPVIYPIPNPGSFVLRSPMLDSGIQVRLFDLSGGELPLTMTRSEGEFTIATEAATGMYILQIITSEGAQIKRSIGIVR
ncbi:MAG: T9SS type A sorting domain-containing protein, partial [Bacteroidota bacterium]|nr:T9SS type A sorting domain-containing protein [Bacteroidota bacterium]